MKKEATALVLLERHTIRLEADGASAFDLVGVRDELKETSVGALRQMFTILLQKETNASRELLADAIAYSLQVLYYPKIMGKPVSEAIQKKAQELVQQCSI